MNPNSFHISSFRSSSRWAAPNQAAPACSRRSRPLQSCAIAELAALPHAIDFISALLDCATPARWSIERACGRNDLRVLQRVAARESPSIDPFSKAYLASKGVAAALRNANLKIVTGLCMEFYLRPVEGSSPSLNLPQCTRFRFFDQCSTDHSNVSNKKPTINNGKKVLDTGINRVKLVHSQQNPMRSDRTPSLYAAREGCLFFSLMTRSSWRVTNENSHSAAQGRFPESTLAARCVSVLVSWCELLCFELKQRLA